MCEWTQVYKAYANAGKYNGVRIPGVNPGRCMECSRSLSVEEMWPINRCSRSLCQSCYERKFNRVNYNCVECGGDISDKVQVQGQNWREVGNHLCDKDSCRALWAFKHATVTGTAPQYSAPVQQIAPVEWSEPVGEPVPEEWSPPVLQESDIDDLIAMFPDLPELPEDPYLEEPEDPNVIDGEYTESPDFPQLEDRRLLLPEPDDSLRLPDFFQKRRERERVIAVPLKKRKGRYHD